MIQEAQISQSVVAILEAIGENPAREGLRDTPKGWPTYIRRYSPE